MKLTIRRVVITACSLGLGHLISCHYVSPNRSRPGLYDIESINWKWKMEPISWLPGCPWGQTPDFIHPIDQFFGYWVAEPVFVKKTWQHTRLCFFFFFYFPFSPQTPTAPSNFPDYKYKMVPLSGGTLSSRSRQCLHRIQSWASVSQYLSLFVRALSFQAG